MAELGVIECIGVDEHGRLLYRGTGRPWPEDLLGE
jgi:hypothetical protein